MERCIFRSCSSLITRHQQVRVAPGRAAILGACVAHEGALFRLADRCRYGRSQGVLATFIPRVTDQVIDLFTPPYGRDADIAALLNASNEVEYRSIVGRLAARTNRV
jgi:hypothetical protein